MTNRQACLEDHVSGKLQHSFVEKRTMEGMIRPK